MNGYNYNNMARAYKFYGENIDRSKYQDSIKYYLEALKRDPHNAYFGLDLATVYINTGDFTKAAALCEQFMKDYPDFATPFSYMGYIYMLAAKQKAITKDKDTAGFLEKAKDYYTQAADPSKQWFRDYVSMSSTYSNLAIIYFNEGNKPRAIELFNRAITEWPQYKEGYYNLAVLYENGGDLKKAAQTYQQMLSVMPDDERAKSELEKLTKRGIK
jgi:tetratricopeptide (TPR) repeat protein